MRSPPSFLRRVRRVAVVLSFALPACAAELPEETLVVVAAKSLPDLDATATRLLEPWRLKFNGLAPIFQRLAPGADVPTGPVAVGFAKNAAGTPPFAIVATDQPDALERALDARPAIGGKITSIAGYPVFVTRVEGGLCLAYSGAMRRVVDGVPLADIEHLLGDADAALAVTDRGFDEAAMWASRLGFVRGRIDLRRIRSLKALMATLPRLGGYAPLLRSLALETEGATLRVTADPDGGSLDATLDVAYAEPDETPPSPAGDAPPLDALVGDQTPLATFRTDRPLPAPLVRVALAWVQSRPDDIDADRFDARAFAAYAESAAAMYSRVTLARTAWLVPEGDAPLSANELEFVRVRPGADFVEALSESTEAMNEAVRLSRARTPLVAVIDPLETPGGPGVRLTTDVLGALGGDGLEGLREIVERYYGPGGRHVVDVTPLADDGWLRSSTPEPLAAAARTRLDEARAHADAEGAELLVWLDRWLAWRQRLDDVGKDNDLGRKVRPPMAPAPPLRLRLYSGKQRLNCELTLPTQTHEALAGYWVTERVDAQPAP